MNLACRRVAAITGGPCLLLPAQAPPPGRPAAARRRTPFSVRPKRWPAAPDARRAASGRGRPRGPQRCRTCARALSRTFQSDAFQIAVQAVAPAAGASGRRLRICRTSVGQAAAWKGGPAVEPSFRSSPPANTRPPPSSGGCQGRSAGAMSRGRRSSWPRAREWARPKSVQGGRGRVDQHAGQLEVAVRDAVLVRVDAPLARPGRPIARPAGCHRPVR